MHYSIDSVSELPPNITICTPMTKFFALILILFDLSVVSAQNNPAESSRQLYIIREGEVLFCEGDSPAAQANNRAAKLMQSGDYKEAVPILSEALTHAPLFYPYHCNIGKCYMHLLDFRRSQHHFTKAKQLVPEHFLSWLLSGQAYELEGDFNRAIDNFRKAAQLDPDYLQSYIFLGDVFLRMGRLQTAEKYYEYTLSKNPYYTNGIIGKAKLLFNNKNYYKAYQTLKIINTEKAEYDKVYHYLFAECAYNLQNYEEAYNQYTKLLEFRADRFFITTGVDLIEHKRELSRRFTDQERIRREFEQP